MMRESYDPEDESLNDLALPEYDNDQDAIEAGLRELDLNDGDTIDDDDPEDAAFSKWLGEEREHDAAAAFKAQVRKVAQVMSNLPGFLCEKLGGAYLPLGDDPYPLWLRNLFQEAAHIDARQKVTDADVDVAFFAGQYLAQRNEAMGKFCYNLACLKRLPEEAPRPGHPRLYCDDRCKEVGKKQHQRNAKDPRRWQVLRDLNRPRYVVAGYTGQARNGMFHKPLRTADFDDPTWKKTLEKRKPPKSSARDRNRRALQGMTGDAGLGKLAGQREEGTNPDAAERAFSVSAKPDFYRRFHRGINPYRKREAPADESGDTSILDGG